MKLSRSLEVAVGMVLGQIAAAVIAFYMQRFFARRSAREAIKVMQDLQHFKVDGDPGPIAVEENGGQYL